MAAPLDDSERIAALADTALLDSAPEESFDRLTRMVTQLLGAPVSLVSLVDDKRQFFKSQTGLEGWASEDRQTPLTHSFCQYVVIDRAPLIITDAKANFRVCDNLAIPDLGVRAYLGVPLTLPSGHVIGSLCAIDTVPHEWSSQDLKLLLDVAEIVMTEIGLRREIARRREAEDNQELLIAELHHRVKNTLSTVQALIQLNLTSSPTLAQFRDTIGVRIASLANTHTLLTHQRWRAISFRDMLNSELEPYDQQGRVVIEGRDFNIDAEPATAIGMVIHELTTNAAKHGALSIPGGKIDVSWHTTADPGQAGLNIAMTWRETGGPGVSHDRKKGFGSSLIERLIVKQFRGTTTFDFAPQGLVFSAAFTAPRAS
ncbi:MAG: HWE histidine kinase domain-containing protein [Pseudomonadota bacterium]